MLAQSLAEGAERVLLIVPKSLIGQWQDELLNLFGIQAREDQTNFFGHWSVPSWPRVRRE